MLQERVGRQIRYLYIIWLWISYIRLLLVNVYASHSEMVMLQHKSLTWSLLALCVSYRIRYMEGAHRLMIRKCNHRYKENMFMYIAVDRNSDVISWFCTEITLSGFSHAVLLIEILWQKYWYILCSVFLLVDLMKRLVNYLGKKCSVVASYMCDQD
jgi:hypothetical protein